MMFYTQLFTSKRGSLAKIWLAAHWERKITKDHVFDCNLENTVKDILSTKMKIGLRTSSHLLLGVVRMYSRKTKYLLADCNDAVVKIKVSFRPGLDMPVEGLEATIEKITKIETFTDFDTQLPHPNDSSLYQSRTEEITLKEDFENGFLNLVDFGEESQCGMQDMSLLHRLDSFGDENTGFDLLDFITNSCDDIFMDLITELPQSETPKTPPKIIQHNDDNKMDPMAMEPEALNETVLLTNEEEGFALEPVAVTPTMKKKEGKRKRSLVVDHTKELSNEAIRGQLADPSDLVGPLDMAPPIVQLMQWKENGGADRLFVRFSSTVIHSQIQQLFTKSIYRLESNPVGESDPELTHKYKQKVQESIITDNLWANDESVDLEIMRQNAEDTFDKSRNCSEMTIDNDMFEFSHPEHPSDSMFIYPTVLDDGPESTVIHTQSMLDSQDLKKNRMNKQVLKLLHTLKTKSTDVISLAALFLGSSRSQVAATFFCLLVQKREQALDLQQSTPYDDTIVTPGPSLETAMERELIQRPLMSLTPGHKPSAGQRRRSAGTSSGSGQYFHGDASTTNTYPGRARAVEGSPSARTHPNTPRRQVKQATCSDNHGIRPPTPEQYLTPLQQKEVCIRHLRARLRENVERLQHRDCEIDDLRTQLYRMQEDWIEEECHRVEAQLALKEARREIQHLQGVVESVKTNLGVREHEAPDGKPRAGLQGVRPGRKSRSCGCSPASTLSRSTMCTRLSSEALAVQLERNLNAPPAGAPQATGQKHLLLEAALLSEQLPPRRHPQGHPTGHRSPTYERLCSGGAMLPISHSCHTLSSSCRCSGHTYLPHHHLFLHLPQEEVPPATASSAALTIPMATPAPVFRSPAPTHAPPPPATERRPEVRSQACSPTMTWLSEEGGGEELSVISSAAVDVSPLEPHLFSPSLLPVHSHSIEPTDKPMEIQILLKGPQTSQPQPMTQPIERQEVRILAMEDVNKQGSEGADGAEEERTTQLCHWSRYFLVDLLALVIPVVPTVAWLCRCTPREVMPTVPISLLRGCCAVALHSLRRRDMGRGCVPTNMNGATPI